MTTILSPVPVFRGFANDGTPLVGGQLFTYVAGTTTPQATWVDSTQTTQNTNPVILNSRGEANVWLDPSLTYKYVLQDSAGNPIWTVDRIFGGAGGAPVSFVPQILFNGGGSLTYSTRNASYTVIGHLFTFSVRISWSALNAPVGNPYVPMPAPGTIVGAEAAFAVAISGLTGLTAGTTVGFLNLVGNNNIFLYNQQPNTLVILTAANFAASGGTLVMSGSYQI
jgi:hypothetical protein